MAEMTLLLAIFPTIKPGCFDPKHVLAPRKRK
jgi:hypothetical protein